MEISGKGRGAGDFSPPFASYRRMGKEVIHHGAHTVHGEIF